MLPTAVTQELVIHWCAAPIGLLQKLEQSVEMRAFNQDLFPFFDVWNFLSKSTKLKFPVNIFKLKILGILGEILKTEFILKTLFHHSLGRIRLTIE
jgi:hypothetical protein